MSIKILEMSNRSDRGGRKKIRMALLTIHQNPTETNENGLHWDENYVRANMDSLSGIPICASFLDDDKEIPFDHGFTEIREVENGVKDAFYENSEIVGSIQKGSIEDIEINGVTQRLLVADGYLYYQRYPKFVNYVKKSAIDRDIKSSIEIMGLESNQNKIVYAENDPTPEFRTPKQFSFSGTAILGVRPADNNAYVLEVAQQLDGTKNKEENTLDEKMIRDTIVSTLTELNSKNDDYEAQIESLKSDNATKDQTISELNQEIETLKSDKENLEKKVNDIQVEVNSLSDELNTVKSEKSRSDMQNAIQKFSEEERKYAEVEINEFEKDPLNHQVDAIVTKILAGIGAAKMKSDEEAAKIAEQNSKDHQDLDLYSDVDFGNDDNSDIF